MGGRWQGIQMTMPQEISPSSWTFTPRRSTITTMTMTRQGHSPSGSSLHWWEVVPPSLPSIMPSTNSLLIIGDLWPRSTGTERWMSNAKALLPKSTSSNKRWKRPTWNEVSVKGDSRRPRLIGMSAVSTLAKQEHDTSRTKYEETYFTKHDGNTAVDVDVHSDEEHGITGLGYQTPL